MFLSPSRKDSPQKSTSSAKASKKKSSGKQTPESSPEKAPDDRKKPASSRKKGPKTARSGSKTDKSDLVITIGEDGQSVARTYADFSIQQAGEIASLQTQLQKKDREIEKLEKKVGKPGKKKSNDPFMVPLTEALKYTVWAEAKFVYQPSDVLKFTKRLFQATGIPDLFEEDGQKLSKKGREDLKEYSEACRHLLNDHRNNCINQIKNEVFKWLKDQEIKQLPPMEEFLKILQRDQDADKDIFAWYWQDLLPKAAGASKIWSSEVKFFGRISDHSPENAPDKPYITPTTEAFLVVVLENYHSRWPALYQMQDKSKLPVRYTKTSTKRLAHQYNYVDTTKNPAFNAKFTPIDGGQKNHTGWSDEGLKRFVQLWDLNKEARKKKQTKALEDKILAKIRKENGITGDTFADFQRNQGKKEAAATPKTVQNLFDFGDDFEDDWENLDEE